MPTASLAPSPIPLLLASETSHPERLARDGILLHLMRGVYVSAAGWQRLAPWEKYVVRVHGALQRFPNAVACLESASALQRMPIFGDPGTVHLLSDELARSRRAGAIEFHTSRDHRVIEDHDGILTTSPVDTAVDLARVRHPAVGLAVADAVLRANPDTTVGLLVATSETRSTSRGRTHALWALHRATAAAESALESVDRAVIEWLGYPEPELQQWIGGDRVDKWWPEHLIAGEGDGDLKYTGADGPNEALRARHQRDARLFAQGVRAVPHWGWSEALAAEPLAALLTSAGLPRVRPRDVRPLASLRRALAGSPRP